MYKAGLFKGSLRALTFEILCQGVPGFEEGGLGGYGGGGGGGGADGGGGGGGGVQRNQHIWQRVVLDPSSGGVRRRVSLVLPGSWFRV